MRNIITSTWISLDGFMAGPEGAMDWVGELYDEAMGQYEGDLLAGADTLLLGRVTYQSFAGSWPHVPDSPTASQGEKEYARRLNAMRKIVFSRTLDRAEWNNSILRKELVAAEIEQLKREPGDNMLIYGSASLVRALTDFGLIDEYQVLIHPLLLGGGKSLFQSVRDRTKLTLIESKTHPSGVVVLSYRRARG
jgi:dihydrofolate reductase